MSTNTLKIRVKNFLAMNRISNSEFAEIAGVSAAYVTSIKENMSLEMLKKVYDINPSVSLPWLLWGVGDMYTNTEKEVSALKAKNTQLADKVAMLEKIVALYERNETAKQSPA